jgi:ketosteroid isomerase-like protein
VPLHRNRTIMMIAAAAGLLAGACRIQEVPRPERVTVGDLAREQIRATLDDYRAALIRGDADALAAFFTPDARMQEPGASDLVGAGSIRGARAESFRDRTYGDLVLRRDSIHLVDGGFAYEMGEFTESFNAAGADSTVHGRYAIRWRRGPEGRWLIERFMVNHVPAGS